MSDFAKRSIITAILFLIVPIIILYLPWYAYASLLLVVLLIILFTEWPKLFDYKKSPFWLIMPIYPILPIFLLIKMQHDGYYLANLFAFLSVGFHDTGSYIFGKLFGKHKLLPKISPGKTWEGFIGGVFSVYLMSFIFYKIFSINIGPIKYILPILISTISLCGDLFESYLKRRVNLKDTSSFLPGHGGLLDRCDSILFLAFFIYLIKDLFMKI